MSEAVSARGLVVRRGNRVVLDGVDLTVRRGELVTLVGPNGAGKSTLLAALAGSLRSCAGSVELLGDPLPSLTAAEQARRRAVLPQDHTIGFGFSCREVVRMGRHPWSRTEHADADAQVVEEEMRTCAVEELAERQFTSLSGGERARVALTRVLAQRTPVLMLDEPTAAMDLRHQEVVMGLVRRRAHLGAAAIVVVHDLSLAAAYSDRVVVLQHGRVRADGPADVALTPPLLSDVYGVPITVAEHHGQPVVLPARSRDACSHRP